MPELQFLKMLILPRALYLKFFSVPIIKKITFIVSAKPTYRKN